MSPSVKSRKAAEKNEDKSNRKEVEAKKKIKPQSSVPPENDKPSIGPSKPVQPKKVAQSSPYQMGETASSVMSIKSQGNKSDEGDLATPPKKVREDKCNRKDGGDKSVPPNKQTKAEKKNEPQLTLPPD